MIVCTLKWVKPSPWYLDYLFNLLISLMFSLYVFLDDHCAICLFYFVLWNPFSNMDLLYPDGLWCIFSVCTCGTIWKLQCVSYRKMQVPSVYMFHSHYVSLEKDARNQVLYIHIIRNNHFVLRSWLANHVYENKKWSLMFKYSIYQHVHVQKSNDVLKLL